MKGGEIIMVKHLTTLFQELTLQEQLDLDKEQKIMETVR